MQIKFIDCHAHVFSDRSLPYEEQKTLWQQAGLSRVIHVFCLETDVAIAHDKLQNNPDETLHFCAGITPHGAKDATPEAFALMRKYQDQLVCIGEIGLDFHYNLSPQDTQIEVFHQQIQLAIELQKPIMLHLRDADELAQEILQQYITQLPGIMFHCYTSGPELAQWGIANGVYISASGIVTFKNSKELREIFQNVPKEQLLIETDSPYLAPTPHRGQKNHPALVMDVYRYLADFYSMPVEDLANQVWENSCRLFGLPR